MKGLIKGGFLYWAMMVAALSGCSERPVNAIMIDKLPVIYPDYTDVTIPAGIAPLNFNLMDDGQLRKEADAKCVDVREVRLSILASFGQLLCLFAQQDTPDVLDRQRTTHRGI